MLNKPIESICGYLTVLPGAFSAFRWAAVEVRPRSTSALLRQLGCLWARLRCRCWLEPSCAHTPPDPQQHTLEC